MMFVCQSESMQALLARARLIAGSEGNVLISGECGVGKKALARSFHEWSRPTGTPFVCIHCGSTESERDIGSESTSPGRSSFTRTLRERVASAAGGTVLFDEVANLTDSDQRVLLGWLQEIEHPAVAERRNKPRCINTTRLPVANLAAAGGLRQELFHHLHVLHLSIPPLRDRIEDIPALAQFFLSQIRQQHLFAPMTLDAAALAKLQRHSWPGNVRELRNTLLRACFVATRDIIGAAEIEASLVPAAVEAPQQYDQLKLADIERRVILRRLDRFHGNKVRAAADLGVTDRTLRNKMREYRQEGFVE